MTVTGFTETALPGPYARAVSPARYAVERGDWKAAAALEVRPSPLPQVQAITYFARARGRRPLGRSGSRQGRHRQAWPNCRTSCVQAKDAYWAGAGRYPEADRDRLGALCRRQARRGADSHECGRRCRGQDREASRDTGRAQAGARVLRRHAARERHGQGSARRLRSDAEEGAQPARRLCRRGKGRREGRRSGQGREYYGKVVAIASDADKTRADVNDARAFLAKKS